MNNLGKVGESSQIGYKSSPVEEGLIEKALPLEIFEKVLSYLGDRDIQQANLVSHLWNKLSIDTSKYEEFSKIKNFVSFLSANLKEESYASIKEQLLGIIGSETEILNSVNLVQVESSIHKIKEIIINILKDLNEGDLKSLAALSKNETKPKFFEDFFWLVNINKRIDNANQISDLDVRNETLKDISVVLTQKGYVNRALEVAKMLPQFAINEASIFYFTSYELTKKGKFDEALTFANKIAVTISDLRNDALERVSRALIESGNFDKAKEIAYTISDSRVSSRVLHYITHVKLYGVRILL